jgi:hypothetical protein
LPPAGKHSDQPEPRADFPDPAAALAEIAHRYTGELVASRFELHALEQLMRAALVLGALRSTAAQILGAAREPVAQQL